MDKNEPDKKLNKSSKDILHLLLQCPNGISLANINKLMKGQKDLMDVNLDALINLSEHPFLILDIKGFEKFKITSDFSECGMAYFGISIKEFNEKYNMWVGGVLGIKEIVKLKEFLDKHIRLYYSLKHQKKLKTFTQLVYQKRG